MSLAAPKTADVISAPTGDSFEGTDGRREHFIDSSERRVRRTPRNELQIHTIQTLHHICNIDYFPDS